MEPTRDHTLDGLTSTIVENSKIISNSIKDNGLPHLSFDVNGPAAFPVPPTFVAAQGARLALIEATKLLERLVVGPTETVQWIAMAHHDTANFRSLLRFKVFHAVPVDGSATYAEIAEKIGLDEGRTRRLIQYATANLLFKEPEQGHVAHTAQSATIVRDEGLEAMLRHHMEDVYPAGARYTDWISAHPVDHGEPTENGWSLAFNTDKPFFEYMKQDPERSRNFDKAMGSISVPGGMWDGAHVVRGFDWASLGDATVVDVGGGRGHISALIARSNPKLKFVVEDLPSTVEVGKEELPTNLSSRFEFLAHDFFTPQPDLSSRGKLVYFMRAILHDWPDKYAVRILRNLIPGLKEGSTVLINDTVMPPLGTANMYIEKLIRTLDMQMLVCLNARERTKDDFERLLKEADPRFNLVSIHTSPGSSLSIVEARFSEEKTAV